MPFEALKKAARFAFADGGSLKARVLRSGLWVAVSEVASQSLNILRSVLLARLLSPEMFGLMGLALIVVRAVETFTRPGIAQALIARQGSFEEARGTAFTMLVGRGFVLAALLAILAPWIARFYESTQLELVLQVLSAIFVINSFVNINTIARQKDLDFRVLTWLGQVTNITGTVVTITVAWWRRDVWALVIGQIVTASLNALLSYWFVPGRMRFEFRSTVARDLLTYGKYITASSAILYISQELDSAVIGKVLSAEHLGYYTLAFTVAQLLTSNLAKIASSVMMPAYSKLQSDVPALRNAFLRTQSLVLFVVIPATVGLIVVAEPLIRVVYGEKWLGAAVPLQVLAVFGLFRALAAFNGYLFEGMGLPGIAFRLGIIRLAIIAPLIVPAAKWFGLWGAAVTVTMGIAAQWLVGLIYLRRHLQVGPAMIGRTLFRPLWTAAAMALVAWLTTIAWDAGKWGGLIGTIGSAVGVYGLLNYGRLVELKNERLRKSRT